MAIQLHSVDVYEKDNGLSLVKTFRTEDELIGDNEKRSVRQLSSAWKPTETIPNDIHTIKYDGLDDDRKQAFDRKTLDDRINENVTFITKDHKLIYPELKVNQRIGSDAKTNPTSGGKPPPKKVFSDMDLQTWYYTKVK